jgi:hypothetical protein
MSSLWFVVCSLARGLNSVAARAKGRPRQANLWMRPLFVWTILETPCTRSSRLHRSQQPRWAIESEGGILLWWQSLATEFAITASNGEVWLSIGQALLFGGLSLVFGIWIARKVGLLSSGAPAGETMAVGLASGLLVLAAWWAAIASGGRSSFTPVAVGFALSIGLAMTRRARRPRDTDSIASAGIEMAFEAAAQSSRHRSLILTALAGGTFIAAVALLYGSTMAPSPRNGVQPVEFNDEAYYAVLGADLAKSGTETIYSPSGFSQLEGVPPQTWYHWGELWLASAVITVFGTAPIHARYFIVLPVVLLAAAALTGTFVGRIATGYSRRSYMFGFLACLFLAPIPLIPGPFFSSWAVGMIFGITMYGVVAVAVLLALYTLAVFAGRTATWALAWFVGCSVAFIVPAHIVIAVLALVGVGSVWTIRVIQSLRVVHSLPVVSPIWRRTFAVTSVAIAATVLWGFATGHGMGNSALSPDVPPFNSSWRDSVAIAILGAGTFLAIGVAWLLVRKTSTVHADVYAGTMVLLLFGAIAWGARLGDFNMFHVFYGGIAVYAVPVAAVAVWSVAMRLRATGHSLLAIATLLLCVGQMEFGVGLGILRLQRFGPGHYAPAPVELLAAIRGLPSDAKVAYACRPSEEILFWDARLVALEAHTGRPVVPMCFQAEFFGSMTGVHISAEIPSPLFRLAPQRKLYPDLGARPSSASIVTFLIGNGIRYIYADDAHPNSLVPEAIPIAASGDAQLLRIP